MIVHIKLYASLRRYRPSVELGQTFQIDLPAGATVAQLIHEELRLPPKETAIVLVNGIRQSWDCVLNDGDLIALWPPIAGG